MCREETLTSDPYHRMTVGHIANKSLVRYLVTFIFLTFAQVKNIYMRAVGSPAIQLLTYADGNLLFFFVPDANR